MTLTPPQGAQSADPVRELLNNLRDAATEAVNATAAANRPQPAPGERRYEVEAHGALTIAINAVESALRTALAAPEGPAPEPVASALMDNQGELINFHSRRRDFFGALLDDDGYIHDRDDEARADEAAAGRAPHRATLLYAAAPEAPPPVQPLTGWINVDERKPERFVEVLIAFRDVTLPATGQYTASVHDTWGWCFPKENDPEDSGPITHWMPLPEHPSAALAAPAGAIQPPLDHQVGAK